MTARVLIAGCGYVGAALGRRLVAAGDQVWGLRRSPGQLPAGIQPLAADLLQPQDLATLPSALDTVFYVAAAGAHDDAAYAAAYVHGLSNLLEALVRQGQPGVRVIFTSSSGVYAETEGGWVDEGAVLRSDDAPSRHIVSGEQLLAASGFPTTVVRFSGIYGPGRIRLIRQVRDGTVRLQDGSPLWTNRIHRDDCAGVLEHLMRLRAPQPVYLASDDEPVLLDEVLQWIAGQLGRSLPGPPSAGFAVEPGSARLQGQGKRCRNRRLRQSGYILRYPSYRDGYAALLSETMQG